MMTRHRVKKKVADLIEALKENDPDKRGYTAVELANIGKDAVPSLLKAIEDKNVRVRMGAAWALGLLNPLNCSGPHQNRSRRPNRPCRHRLR
jgi:HEAT repeat protein